MQLSLCCYATYALIDASHFLTPEKEQEFTILPNCCRCNFVSESETGFNGKFIWGKKMMRIKKVSQTRRNLIKNAALAVAGVGVGAGLSPKKAEAQPQKPATAASPAPSSLPLAGKVALVTGAARGIGLATAVELARQGADIALLDIAQPQGVKNIHSYRLANRTELMLSMLT
ncbi:hypothetical protein NUACC21_27230 [Scytonema sp. NUACC21]